MNLLAPLIRTPCKSPQVHAIQRMKPGPRPPLLPRHRGSPKRPCGRGSGPARDTIPRNSPRHQNQPIPSSVLWPRPHRISPPMMNVRSSTTHTAWPRPGVSPEGVGSRVSRARPSRRGRGHSRRRRQRRIRIPKGSRRLDLWLPRPAPPPAEYLGQLPEGRKTATSLAERRF